MSDYVRFKLPDGGSLILETEEPIKEESGEKPMGLFGGKTSKVQDAEKTLLESLKDFVPAANVMITEMRKLAPDEITLEMGMSLSAQLGVTVAKTSGKGHIKATLSWKAKEST